VSGARKDALCLIQETVVDAFSLECTKGKNVRQEKWQVFVIRSISNDGLSYGGTPQNFVHAACVEILEEKIGKTN
jgi:hypothetical protein